MPSYGEKQKSAGMNLSKPAKKAGTLKMESRNTTIKSTLKIDTNCEYKGNAVLNANK
jgi:hypothetical protein